MDKSILKFIPGMIPIFIYIGFEVIFDMLPDQPIEWYEESESTIFYISYFCSVIILFTILRKKRKDNISSPTIELRVKIQNNGQ